MKRAENNAAKLRKISLFQIPFTESIGSSLDARDESQNHPHPSTRGISVYIPPIELHRA
jgi:hypothetical protein